MASITTKKGDGGQTSLYGGGRLPKHAPRIEAYGEIDELSTLLGLARASGVGAILEEKVVRIQEELMALGAVLATLPHSPAAPRLPPLLPAWAECMEAEMEVFERALPPLRQFVLPGGRGAPPPPCGHPPSLATRQGGAVLHVARAVARRAERRVVALMAQEEVAPEAVPYLNRLSDWLFMAARYANHEAGVEELLWSPSRPEAGGR